MSRSFRLGDVRALLIDIDGTLVHGQTLLPGVGELFAFLDAQQVSYAVASNTATRLAADIREKLSGLGVQIEEAQILTAGAATVRYLERELGPGAELYVIGEPVLRHALRRAGFVLHGDAARPVDAVVAGGDWSLTYDKLKHAALLLQRGARFVGTNPDLAYPTEEGLVPETGATLAALQAATGRAPTVIGKPARFLFELALDRLGSRPAETAMLGDRLETDILGGLQAGLRTVLVTSGVDDERTMVEKGIEPDLVVSGLGALVDLWKQHINTADNEEATR